MRASYGCPVFPSPNMRAMIHAIYDARERRQPGPPPSAICGQEYARATIARPFPSPICGQWYTGAAMRASYDCPVLPLHNMRAMIHASYDAREL